MKTTIVLILVLAMAGCANLGTGIYGATKYEMTFSDRQPQIDPETGADLGSVSDTQFKVKMSGRAADVLKDLAAMNYVWNPDASGSISVSSDTLIDSTARSALITEYRAQQSADIQSAIGLLGAGLSLAAPILGQKLEIDAQAGATKVADKEVQRQELLDFLRDPTVLSILSERMKQLQLQPAPTTP